jgi:hypothetical protein
MIRAGDDEKESEQVPRESRTDFGSYLQVVATNFAQPFLIDKNVR